MMLGIGDDAINGYIDGALDPSRALAVGAYLAVHPREAARAAAYRAQRDMLRALFDHVLAQPVPDRLAVMLRRHDRRATVLRRAWAAVAVCLALGALGLGGSALEQHLSLFDSVLSPPPHDAPAARPQQGRFIHI